MEIKGEIDMNNSTVEQFNIKVKLRGDNMYDLYIDAEHVATRGSYKGIVEEICREMENRLL